MATRYTDEFRRDAMRIATTSGLTRRQVSSDRCPAEHCAAMSREGECWAFDPEQVGSETPA